MKHFINLSLKQARRLVVTVIGATVILLGLIFIPLPGPGLLGIFAGLAILATEFLWARRLLQNIKRKTQDFRAAVTRATRSNERDPAP